MSEFSFDDDIEETEVEPDAHIITGPGGSKFECLNQDEKTYFEQTAEEYQKDFSFSNASDLAELDRILTMETLIFRYGNWLSRQKDYSGGKIDMKEYQGYFNTHNKGVLEVKRALGIDKSSRDKARGSSFAEMWENLRTHCMELGIVRNEQAIKSISIMRELFGKIQFHKNSHDDERKEFHATAEDIVEWIWGQKAEFDKIDAEFRETSQKFWIGKDFA